MNYIQTVKDQNTTPSKEFSIDDFYQYTKKDIEDNIATSTQRIYIKAIVQFYKYLQNYEKMIFKVGEISTTTVLNYIHYLKNNKKLGYSDRTCVNKLNTIARYLKLFEVDIDRIQIIEDADIKSKSEIKKTNKTKDNNRELSTGSHQDMSFDHTDDIRLNIIYNLLNLYQIKNMNITDKKVQIEFK